MSFKLSLRPTETETLGEQQDAGRQGERAQDPHGDREPDDDVQTENDQEDCKNEMSHGIRLG